MQFLNESSRRDLEEKSKIPGNTDIQVVTSEELFQVVPSVLKPGIEFRLDIQGVVYPQSEVRPGKRSSTPDHPAIIFENGIRPCTLIAVYDEKGSCQMLHRTFYLNFVEPKKLIPITRNNMDLDNLKKFMNRLNGEFKIFITGTNVKPELREQVVDYICKRLGVERTVPTYIFNASEKASQENAFMQELGITKDIIHAALFIPEQFTVDAKNRFFIMNDEDLQGEKYDKTLKLYEETVTSSLVE